MKAVIKERGKKWQADVASHTSNTTLTQSPIQGGKARCIKQIQRKLAYAIILEGNSHAKLKV